MSARQGQLATAIRRRGDLQCWRGLGGPVAAEAAPTASLRDWGVNRGSAVVVVGVLMSVVVGVAMAAHGASVCRVQA